MPQNVKNALNPPNKLVTGTETIAYTNKNPKPLNGVAIKLILNIHTPCATWRGNLDADYITDGIIIEEFTQNDKATPWKDAKGNTTYLCYTC